MKTLTFLLFPCSITAIKAQTLPQSSDKDFAKKFSANSPKHQFYQSYNRLINQKKNANVPAISYEQKTYSMSILDVKGDNSVIRIYEPDSSFRSNMKIVRNYK